MSQRKAKVVHGTGLRTGRFDRPDAGYDAIPHEHNRPLKAKMGSSAAAVLVWMSGLVTPLAATAAQSLGAAPTVTPAVTPAAAPQTGTGRPGFGISPSYQSASLASGQPSLQYDLQLTNTTARDQQFDLSAVDFGSLDESGGVAFLGTPATEGQHRYGLASWMQLGASTVLVRARASSVVAVTVQNRQSLAPGGHYGAVLATAVADPGGANSGDPRVNLRQVLSSLILLTKEGGAAPSLKLVSQTPDRSGLRLPSSVSLRFQNDGNLHVVPRGVTTLTAPGGRVIARGAINEGSAVLLPESFRQLDTPLTELGSAWLPGRYTLSTTYRFDGLEATKTYITHIWYIGQLAGWGIIVAGLALVIGLVVLILYGRRRGWRVGRFIAGLMGRMRRSRPDRRPTA